MQRPGHGNFRLRQIAEQNLIVEIVAVDVVKVDDVRMYFRNPLNQNLRLASGSKAMPVKYQAIDSVAPFLERSDNLH